MRDDPRDPERYRAAGGPSTIYLLLFPIPVVCFVGALLTDMTYQRTEWLMWLHFSQWLIASGLAFGALAALVLLVHFIASAVARARVGWMHFALFYLSLAVEFVNALVHTADGWTAVVPNGLLLSVVGAVLAVAAAVMLLRTPVHAVRYAEARP